MTTFPAGPVTHWLTAWATTTGDTPARIAQGFALPEALVTDVLYGHRADLTPAEAQLLATRCRVHPQLWWPTDTNRPVAGEGEWLSTDRTAQLLGVGPSTVRRLIASGQLGAHRIGRLLRVHRDQLDAYLAQVRTTDQPAP
jgi:excisionase family DNA binding protein